MTREQFWALVESTSGGGCRQHAQRLEAELRRLRDHPAGEDWDFDDEAEMRRRYPQLWAKLPWDWDTFPVP
jgi:hypothetical protein